MFFQFQFIRLLLSASNMDFKDEIFHLLNQIFQLITKVANLCVKHPFLFEHPAALWVLSFNGKLDHFLFISQHIHLFTRAKLIFLDAKLDVIEISLRLIHYVFNQRVTSTLV